MTSDGYRLIAFFGRGSGARDGDERAGGVEEELQLVAERSHLSFLVPRAPALPPGLPPGPQTPSPRVPSLWPDSRRGCTCNCGSVPAATTSERDQELFNIR
ncbi:hypothetical protein KM043_002643 [Ampulex compressa]|nr:hypothetical protein KM043_002643 [Ampulex compressa]